MSITCPTAKLIPKGLGIGLWASIGCIQLKLEYRPLKTFRIAAMVIRASF